MYKKRTGKEYDTCRRGTYRRIEKNGDGFVVRL
jgi:hypothetical protein